MPVDPFTCPLHIENMGFTGNWLDRADHLRSDAAALAALRDQADARFLLLQAHKPVLDVRQSRPQLLWLGRDDIDTTAESVFLGLAEGVPHFALRALPGSAVPGKSMDARAAGAQLVPADAAVIAQARSLILWHDRHQHCAVCGAATHIMKAGYQRRCSNPDCAADHFPRTDPVVIMLIIDGDRCLLGRQPQFPPRFMSALAGFVEPGETLEEAVARETFEEAGIRCGRVRYVASQPWPFPSSLMIGCFAEARSFDIKIDAQELEEAHWFSRDACQAALAGSGPFIAPPPVAIAHHLLKAWAELG